MQFKKNGLTPSGFKKTHSTIKGYCTIFPSLLKAKVVLCVKQKCKSPFTETLAAFMREVE